MIFVTVGSQKFPFDRLIKKVDQMVREQLLAEEVFIQTGTSRYVPACRHQAFCEPELFAQWMEDCTVLITHGGAGTMRLQELNLLRVCPDVELLPEVLGDLNAHNFQAFHSNTETFLASLDGYIRSL